MNIFKGSLVLIVMALFVVLLASCASKAPGLSQSPWPAAREEIPENELASPAIIIDATGRTWDVTHARNVYGMRPIDFNFGLGIGAISSVDNPIVIEEGDRGYPKPNSRTVVFGVSHNGEHRAYSRSALVNHEVFNDIYPGESDQYVAVTY
jgi:hypothetical protein